MGNRSSTNRVNYSKPDPFVLPVVWEKQDSIVPGLSSELVPRENINYSAQILEEIMHVIDVENQKRGNIKIQWKKYKSSITDFEVFSPNDNGLTLRSVSMSWFPQYVKDIQDAIDRLIGDDKVPDTRSAYLARVFANNTTGTPGVSFNNVTKLRDNIATKNGTINPLAMAKDGLWPFTDEYIEDPGATLGIGFKKEIAVSINKNPGGIEAYTRGFPQSVIGLTTPSGIGGIDLPMRSDNRPIVGDRIMFKNTSQGIGKGQYDYDQGYTHLAHFPHVVQMLRYQPPVVEWWPENIAIKDYVSNISSTTTPNLPWYHGQQVENEQKENLGFWLMKGNVGVVNNQAILRTYNNPMSQEAERGQCPYSLFYPPPTGNCSCGTIEESYFIWYIPGFKWNDKTWLQGTNVKQLYFGPHTHLKVNVIGSISDNGENKKSFLFRVGVRTARIGEINNQPFAWVIEHEMPISGTLSVELQSKLHDIYGSQYRIGGIDGVTAICLSLEATVNKDWVVTAETYKITYPNGGINVGKRLPAGSDTKFLCKIPTGQVAVDYVALDENAIAGDPVDSYV